MSSPSDAYKSQVAKCSRIDIFMHHRSFCLLLPPLLLSSLGIDLLKTYSIHDPLYIYLAEGLRYNLFSLIYNTSTSHTGPNVVDSSGQPPPTRPLHHHHHHHPHYAPLVPLTPPPLDLSPSDSSYAHTHTHTPSPTPPPPPPPTSGKHTTTIKSIRAGHISSGPFFPRPSAWTITSDRTYPHTHTHTHLSTYTNPYTHTLEYIHTHIYPLTHTNTHTYTHTYTYTQMVSPLHLPPPSGRPPTLPHSCKESARCTYPAFLLPCTQHTHADAHLLLPLQLVGVGVGM